MNTHYPSKDHLSSTTLEEPPIGLQDRTPREAEDSSPSQEESPRPPSRKRRQSIWYYLGGTPLSKLFAHPLAKKAVILGGSLSLLMLVYNYYNIHKLRKINRLEYELHQLTEKQIFVTAELSKLGSEEHIAQRLQKEGSLLAPSATPPYILQQTPQK